MKLHNTISRIYKKIIQPFFSVEVLSEDGKWNKISTINITEEQPTIIVNTQTKSLECAENHILIDSEGNEIFAIDSFGKVIKTVDGNESVISIQQTKKKKKLYDLSLIDDNTEKSHLYFTNGFLSHNCVILDEFAFLQRNLADKLFTSMYPVVSSSKNGKFIIVSTPNGVDNLYYDIWQQANSKEKDKNKEGWKPFTMYWWQVPGHDEKWKEKQIAAIGKQRFAQEFNNEFLANATSHKLIPDDLIEKYRIKLSEYRALDKDFAKGKTQFIKNEAQDKLYEFTMWHEFNPEKTYLASGDCAEGTGLDSSVLYVWDVTDLSNIIQCAKFSSTEVSPVEFAFITSKVLGLYNNPFYVCERNGIGGGYLDSLRITYNYPSIAYEGKNHEAGVFSHITVKERACIWAREMMTTIGFGWTIYDKDLIEEFPTFSRKDNKGVHMVYQALPPAHDDHIMAWIWACYLLHPDKVDNYFICCKTFTSALEKVYPLLLQPLNDYVSRDVKKVIDDPMYKDFMSFKEEVQQKLGKALLEEKTANNNDQFLKQRSMRDPYFGDFDSDWGGYSGSTSHATHTLQHAPRYFVF